MKNPSEIPLRIWVILPTTIIFGAVVFRMSWNITAAPGQAGNRPGRTGPPAGGRGASAPEPARTRRRRLTTRGRLRLAYSSHRRRSGFTRYSAELPPVKHKSVARNRIEKTRGKSLDTTAFQWYTYRTEFGRLSQSSFAQSRIIRLLRPLSAQMHLRG